MNKLKEKLSSQVTIFDGAIGTELYKKGFFVNLSFDGLNLTNKDVISEIHKSYIDAGAEVLTTNSFSANKYNLSKFGLGDSFIEINKEAVRLARAAGNDDTLIAGSIGPIGKINKNAGLTKEKIVSILVEQIEVLSDADFILFETLVSESDIQCAIEAINNFPEREFVLSSSIDRNGDLLHGTPFLKAIKYLKKANHKPSAIGFNCGEGPEGLLTGLETLIKDIDYPIIAQANAGLPRKVDGRSLYMSSPEYMTTYAMRYSNLGIRGIGGCCGTGPEHIENIARSVKPFAKSEYTSKQIITEVEETLLPATPSEKKSKFAAKLARGEWVTTIEITPPRGYDLTATIEKAIVCREAGVDAINLPDGPRASSRISPIVTAGEILRKADIEPILHFCCRDKNLIGMQADILGCAAMNINKVLFITGDPPKLGDYPFASAVFDVDSIGIVKFQDRLNHGIDIGGKSINCVTNTFIGVGVDPNAIDMEREIRRTEEKVANGAEYIISQPVFDTEALHKFLDNISHLDVKFIAGIWPLASYRNAEFMKNEVPGVTVPDSIMERMAKFDNKEDQKKEGIAIAKESIAKIKSRIDGVQVSAPFGNVNTAIAVLN